MENLLEKMEKLDDSRQAQLKNVLVLAFVGDAIYTCFVRTHLAVESQSKSGMLNKMANKFVKAQSQAKAWNKLVEFLTEEEKDVGRRARNCKLNHTAKNASLEDYRDATSLESVIGFNYLANNIARTMELMKMCLQFSCEEME